MIPGIEFIREFLNIGEPCEREVMPSQDRKLCDNILLGSQARLPTRYGSFRIHAFVCPFTGEEHVGLVKGRVAGKKDVLVRLHSECLTGDVFGSERCDCGDQLDAALKRIAKSEEGVLLYLAQEGRGIGITNKIAAYHLQDHGADTVAANHLLGFPADLRGYKCAACMLRVLGVTSVHLMTNNPAKIEELEAYGVKVTKRIPLEAPTKLANLRYLKTKKEKMRHLLSTPALTSSQAPR
jgi:3,4-dihydroxy 2-butanone 4-phosphate synthase/GTP cyclohydrolase II